MRQFVKATRVSRALAAMLALSVNAVAAQAQTSAPGDVVVVELYTAQGCSSCPPADAILSGIADDPGLIALSMHVNYWDYLGWKDVFAIPAFTARQKSYARAAGDRMIYTPQMVIGGTDRIVGSDAGLVAKTLRAHQGKVRGISLTLSRDGDRINIRATAVPPRDQSFRVQLVRYRDRATVEIERGENAGRAATYRNVVTAWEHVADWRATGPFELSAPAPGSDRAAVIIQADGPSEIMAAAALQ